MAEIQPAPPAFEFSADIVIIGAGACGLVAGLAAREDCPEEASILLLERDRSPSGSTSLSSGFMPAAGTWLQREQGVEDSPELLLQDLQNKAKGRSHEPLASAVAAASGPVVEWLAKEHGLPFILIDGFLYPGHSVLRMHAMPQKTGAALQAALLEAAGRRDLPIATGQKAEILYRAEDGRISGVGVRTEDGQFQQVGCEVLILACNGYGGNKALVEKHIPEVAEAVYFGHAGNQGEAVLWGEQLGANLADMSGYQGHGSVAWPHGALISWALMMEGGVLINKEGARFSNEHEGYSEQAARVMAQTDKTAFVLFDDRLLELGRGFPDFAEAETAGAVISADSAEALAGRLKMPASQLLETLADMAAFQEGSHADPLGRDFTGQPALTAPYHAIQVTGALFHTQGGLDIDSSARVLDKTGQPLPNLLAAGGAARGVSGPDVSGYLSGNGLLTALTLGRIAGQQAARMLKQGDAGR